MVLQTHVQAEQAHDQWLREGRQQAYAALLSAGDAVHDALDTVIGHTIHRARDDERRAAWRVVNDALNAFDRAGRTAEIVSPGDVVAQQVVMREALSDVQSRQRAHGLMVAGKALGASAGGRAELGGFLSPGLGVVRCVAAAARARRRFCSSGWPHDAAAAPRGQRDGAPLALQ
jgi:hypothetical protein